MVVQILFLIFTQFSHAQLSACSTYSLEDSPESLLNSYFIKCMYKDSTLYVDGAIDGNLIYELTLNAPFPIKKLSLNSRGGLVADAFEVAAWVRDNNIETEVRENARCMSACTLIFQAGTTRRAHPTALFMYHSARFPHQSQAQIMYLQTCLMDMTSGCEDYIHSRAVALSRITNDLFNLYETYDATGDLRTTYFSLPEDPQWHLNGNYLRIIDWSMRAPEAMAYNIVQELI